MRRQVTHPRATLRRTPILPELKERLTLAGFNSTRLAQLTTSASNWPALALRGLSDTDPLGTFIRLWLLNGAVEAECAARDLAPVSLSAVAETGLLELNGDRVQSAVRLAPYRTLLLASDPAVPGREPPDRVTGVSPSSRTLADLTVRRPAATAVDLGCGCGVQALLAATHCDEVLAVDVTARALTFARFNAALNGTGNVRFRRGSWFEATGDERFDLIVSNMPYVISPDSALSYRDSGRPLDELAQELVGTAPGHLAEGGFAHLMFSWVHNRDGPWERRPASWVQPRGCDALLIRHETHDPLAYAAHWNRRLERDPQAFDATVARWLDHYRRMRVRAISTGVMVLRRRSGAANWMRHASAARAPASPSGGQILQLFELALPARERDLLATRLRSRGDHRIERVQRAADDGEAEQPAVVRLVGGAELAVEVGPATAAVLLRCDGTRTLSEAIATANGALAPRARQPERVVLDEVHRLVELGILGAADGPGSARERLLERDAAAD